MKLIDNIKKIETYICENFEELDLDDPMEEEYFQEYETIVGASEDDLCKFETEFAIRLPEDFKTVYQYKDGSRFMCILPSIIRTSDMCFCLMSLEEIKKCKTYFQNKNALLSDFSECFSPQDIDNMRDNRIKPYLFNKRWIPFAQYCDSCYLMLDFDPNTAGQEGQIICYIHDPDEIVYVSKNITELIEKIDKEL